jgi:WD40 repeat protein
VVLISILYFSYNYHTKKQLAVQKYSCAGTSLCWAPLAVDEYGVTLAAGFEDGVVRIVGFKENGPDKGLKLLKVFKPHRMAVNVVQYSPTGEHIVSCSNDNTVFFLSAAQAYAPIGFVTVGSAPVSLSWSSSGKTLLVCCRGKTVYEFVAPAMNAHDTSESYELKRLSSKEYTFQRKIEDKPVKVNKRI